MKNLTLTFVQRVRILDIIGHATPGNLEALTGLAAAFNTIQFTEAETAQITQTDHGGGRASFTPPDSAFGTLETKLEDSQAAAVLAEMNSWLTRTAATPAGLTIGDLPWFTGLKGQLEAPIKH